MVINYSSNIPEPLKPIIESRIETVRTLFPKWCQDVTIFYEKENPNDFVVAVNSQYYYRYLQIDIYQEFFNDKTWFMTLVHEIMHAIFRPYTAKTEQLIEHCIGNEAFKAYITKDLSDAEEAVTQDSADFVMELTKLVKTDIV